MKNSYRCVISKIYVNTIKKTLLIDKTIESEGDYMKVSIPTKDENGLEGVVEPHFGKAPTYTIIDTETNQVTVIPNTSEHMGGTGLPPEYLHENGVDIMLCGGLGFKAVNMFESYGIKVFVGAGCTVRDTFEAWKAGKLQNATAENSCSEHGHDDHHQC